MSDKPKVQMNGVRIDDTPKVIEASVLSLFEHDIQYRSKDSLLDILNGMKDVVIEHLEAQGKKAEKYKQEKWFINNRIARKSREQIVEYIYNQILRLEGLCNLSGFGFTNKYGDQLKGDAEKVSITYTLKKGF